MSYQNKKDYGSEHYYQEQIRKKLEEQGWLTIKLAGNAYQKGLPDLLCFHRIYGTRFIEVKKKGERWVLTPAQMEQFSKIQLHGGQIFILETVDDIPKLFKPSNWTQHLMERMR